VANILKANLGLGVQLIVGNAFWGLSKANKSKVVACTLDARFSLEAKEIEAGCL